MRIPFLAGLLGIRLAGTLVGQVIELPPDLPSIPATPPPQKLSAPYATDSITLTLAEDPTVPTSAGRSIAEFAAAIGGTITHDLPLGADRYLALSLPATVPLGRAYQLAQSFDFGTPSRWRVKAIYPNSYAYIPEGVPFHARRIFNLSTRAEVRTGEGVTIGGLIMPGEFAQLVVIKVRGASLGAFGVGQPLANPTLRLYAGSNLILQNDDWGSLRESEKTVARDVCPPPDDAREAMIVTYLDPGGYTAVVSGAEGTTGVVLLEMHVVDSFRVVPK